MSTSFKYLFITLACLALTVSSYPESTNKPLKISSNYIYTGSSITFDYCSDSTKLAGEKSIKGIVYFWQDYSWRATDIALQQKGNIWSGEIKIPDDAALVAFKFYSGKKIDTGFRESDYVQFVLKPGNAPTPSSYIGWGLLRGKSTQQYSIPGYVNDSANYIGNDVLRYWYNQEMMHTPAEFKNVYYYAAQTLAIMQPGKISPAIQESVNKIIKSDSLGQLSEQDLMKCIEVVRSYLHNEALAKTLTQRALTKYPDGIQARDNELFRIYRIANNEEKEKEFASFLKRFPASKFENTHTESTGLYYSKLFQSVIYNQIIKNNNYALMYQYIHESPYEILATYFWHMIQIPYKNKLMPAEKLRPYADLIMQEIFSRPRRIDQQVYSESEWFEKICSDRKDALLAYSKILDETGATDQAMKWMRIIDPLFENKSSEFSDFYISLLQKTGHQNEILSIVKAGVKENAASPQMLEILKADYVSTKGSDAGFDAYVNALKDKKDVANQQHEIKKSLINQPIKLFTFDKLNGGKVNMAELKGKIIVLDFWATWCAPCKAAMPGMQMAVNKYKDDKNVAFFFIATMETDPKYKEKINDFISEKKYNFEVLLDGTVNGKLPNQQVYNNYSKAFHFSGIPQKMIIDGNGNLRWMATGYYGSPSALADEISYVITLLKEEEKIK